MPLTSLFFALMVISGLGVCSEPSELLNKKNKASDTESQKFIATHEWQVIRDGQVVPAGLHYRMNLQTGLKEAKLLDESNRVSDPKSAVVPANQNIEANLDGQDKRGKHPDRAGSASGENIDQGNFRSYESLKKEFQSLNLLIKTDLELMNELLVKFTSKNVGRDRDEEEIIGILTDFEYLVHHYDNAQEFARLEGFTRVVYPCLNASSVAIRSEAIRLLGSAIQSNPKTQIMALETGSISSLLSILVLDSTPVIRSRAVYALSCLIRRFPLAQLKMINSGGLSVLGELFQNEGQDDLKLQVKVITLLHDLVMEYKDAHNVPYDGADLQELAEKQRQYGMINLPQHLVEAGWCRRLPRLLKVSSSNSGRIEQRDDLSSVFAEDRPIRPEHDVVEKVIEAMLVLIDYCIKDFRADPDVLKITTSLEKWYSELSAREQLSNKSRNSSDVSSHYFYYTSLATKVGTLLQKLKQAKDEL